MTPLPPKTSASALLLATLLVLPVAAAFGWSSITWERTAYVVAFDDDFPTNLGGKFHGARLLDKAPMHGLVVAESTSPKAFEAALKADPRVRYFEVDDPFFATRQFVPNDARYGESGHWGTKVVGAEAAWDVTKGSTSVKVAVIDSGLRRTHEEFVGQSRILSGYDYVRKDGDPNDECGHGTHVTGILGATTNNGRGVAGMAQVTILPLKALGNTWAGCAGSLSAIVSAMRAARDMGAHVSSNSWGSGSSSASVTDALAYAHSGGVIHVGAAGNSGPCNDCVIYPWKDNPSRSIAVGATTAKDALASFSNTGTQVDIAAPGESILSTYANSNSGYALLSGTSMATPFVSGAIALLLSKEPGLSFAQVESRVKSSALDLGPVGEDNGFGAGRLDVAKLLGASVGGGSTPPPPPPPPAQETTVLDEDFDDGNGNGWTASSGGLWHLQDTCVSDASSPYKLAWTRSGACTYDTGARQNDWIDTPTLDLAGKTHARLTFAHRFDIEQYGGGAFDVLRVEVTRDGSSWTVLEQWDSRGADVTSWTPRSYDLSSFAGGDVRIRFHADTVDALYNAYGGWFVDDVKVVAS